MKMLFFLTRLTYLLTYKGWEVRVGFGNDIFRILVFFDGSQLIILNHAFQKKTQKTPKQAIKIAKARKQDYLKRKKCK